MREKNINYNTHGAEAATTTEKKQLRKKRTAKMNEHKCKRNDKSEKTGWEKRLSWLDVGLSSTISLSIRCAYSDFFFLQISGVFIHFFFVSFVCFLFCVTSSHVFPGALNSTAFVFFFFIFHLFHVCLKQRALRSIFVMSLEVNLSVNCLLNTHHSSAIAHFV